MQKLKIEKLLLYYIIIKFYSPYSPIWIWLNVTKSNVTKSRVSELSKVGGTMMKKCLLLLLGVAKFGSIVKFVYFCHRYHES